MHHQGLRCGLLEDVDNLEAQMLAASFVRVGVTQQLDEDTSLDVVGQDLGGGPVEPEGTGLLEDIGSVVGYHGDASLVLLGHAGRHLVVVGHLDVRDPVARDRHWLADLGEIPLCPVDGAGGLDQGTGDQHHFGEERVILPDLQYGIRRTGDGSRGSADPLHLPPGNLHRARLGGEDYPGIGAPVVRGASMVVGTVGLSGPVIFRTEVSGGQQGAEFVGIGHRDDRTEQIVDPTGHHRATYACSQKHVRGSGSSQAGEVEADRIGNEALVGVQDRRTGARPTDPDSAAEGYDRLKLANRRSPRGIWRQLAPDRRTPAI